MGRKIDKEREGKKGKEGKRGEEEGGERRRKCGGDVGRGRRGEARGRGRKR